MRNAISLLLLAGVVVACQVGEDRDTRTFFQAGSELLFKDGCVSWYDADEAFYKVCYMKCYIYEGKLAPAGSDLRSKDSDSPALEGK